VQPSGTEVVVLNESEVTVRRNERGEAEARLASGRVVPNVQVVPAFPISHPGRYFYLKDAEGREIGVLVDPRRLDRESFDLVAAMADQAYFMPRVTRVLKVEETLGTGIARWEVETDRGWNAFDVASRGESVSYVGKDRMVIRDVDGNRYLIEDLSAMDRRSHTLLELNL
jgi:hypothetical protein